MADHEQRLPDDILQIVVDKVAQQYGQNELIRLFPTSRSFKAWADRLAFRKVVVRTLPQAEHLASALNGRLPFSQPTRHMEYLWLLCSEAELSKSNTLPRDLSSGLALCTGLLHFAGSLEYIIAGNADEQDVMWHLPRFSSFAFRDPFIYISAPLKNISDRYRRLTHLHLMISGHESPGLQDGILQEQFDNFECLQHLILELVYTHPDEKEFAHSFSSETALFSIFQAEELLRRLLDRRPNLQQIVIKSNFYHPRFLALWDDIVSHFRDTPRVVFRLERSPREGHFLDASKAELDITARDVWQGMIQDSLEAAEKMWAAKDIEVS